MALTRNELENILGANQPTKKTIPTVNQINNAKTEKAANNNAALTPLKNNVSAPSNLKPQMTDAEVIAEYESIPKMGVFKRIGSEENRKLYERKQELSGKYNEAKTNLTAEAIKSSGLENNVTIKDMVAKNADPKIIASYAKAVLKTDIPQEDLERYYTNLSNQKALKKSVEKTEETPLLENLRASGQNAFGGVVTSLSTLGNSLTGETDPLKSNDLMTRQASAVRGKTSDMITEALPGTAGKIANTAYGVGTSALDMGTAALASGGNPLAVMAASGFANTYTDAKDRGLTEKEAIALGGIAGGAEALLGKFPVKGLKGIVGGTAKEAGEGLAKTIGKQMLSEGAEEMATEAINTVADRAIAKDKSNYNMLVNQFIQSGMSEEEAKKQANIEQAKQIGYAGLVGGLSGGVMGAGAAAVGNVSGRNASAELNPLANGNSKTSIDNMENEEYNYDASKVFSSIAEREKSGETGIDSGAEASGDLQYGTSDTSRYDNAMEGRRTDGRADSSIRRTFHVIGTNSRDSLNRIGVTNNEFRDTTSNPELFSFALENGKLSNANGAMVDSHTAEQLRDEGAITFLSKDNMAGGAVMPDGNITAVFKNSRSKSRRAGVDIIATALENGGTKLDCYGKNLLDLYASMGFEPVAKVKFNAEYAPDGWDFDKFGMPDIYVMKHNGQSADSVVASLESGNVKKYTNEEINNLPYMEYDEALSYRDSLIDTGALQRNSNTIAAERTGNLRERGYNSTLVNKTDAPQELKNEFINNPVMYQQLSNATTLEAAMEILQNNTVDGAMTKFRDLLKDKSPVAVPLGYNLSKKLTDAGRIDDAVQIVRDMSEALTEAGQFSQAAAITLLRENPQAALRYLVREIDALNRNGAEKFGKKWKDFELTDAEMQKLSGLEQGDKAGISEVYDEVYNRLRKEYPSTFWDKLKEGRRIAMLLNPRTNSRNIVSNALLMPVRWTADRVTALGEGAYSLINPNYQRTQSISPIRSKDARRVASEVYNNVKEELLRDNRYADTKDAMRDKQVFKGGKFSQMLDNITNGALTKANRAMGKEVDPSLLETARNFTYWMLGKGDDVFVKLNFESRLASYLDAQGIKDIADVPPDAIALATQEALKATFKDDSFLSKKLSSVKQGTGVVGELVLPFTKTPANVFTRAAEYSPIGGTKSAFKLKKAIGDLENAKSQLEVNKAFTELGQGLTGTALILAGYFLAKNGLITGALSDDKDEEQFQKQQGMLPYSVKTKSGNYYSYDWAQPAAAPLIFGVTLYQSMNESDNVTNAFLKGTAATLNTLLELSPLQNVANLLGGYKSFGDNVIDLFADAPGGFVPAAVGALARTADTTQRTTYDSSSKLKSVANSIQAKLPELSKKLPAAYDTWGNPIQRQDTTAQAAFANLVNPGQFGNSSITPLDSEITRIYESTDNGAVFPRKAEWTENKVKLNNEQYSEFQRIMGENSYDMVEALMEFPSYASLEDETKAKAIQDLYSFAHALAKAEVAGYDVANSSEFKKEYKIFNEKGAEGVAIFTALSKLKEGTKHEDILNAVNAMDISNEDKGYYFSKLIGDLSKEAQKAYDSGGYAAVYNHYNSKAKEEKAKAWVDSVLGNQSTSGKKDRAWLDSILAGS